MEKNSLPGICNLCGNSRYTLVHHEKRKAARSLPAGTAYTISEAHLEKPDKIVRCLTCGLVYAIPKGPVGDIVKDYVEMADPEYAAEEKGRRRQAQIILRFIGQSKGGGKLLDIGCGPGFFLAEAKAQGWRAQGVDLSGWAKKTAMERFGVEVFQGALAEARFPSKSFDAVVMNDVIEHLEDPKSALQEIRRILKNDGILYISTPDIDSVLSRALGGGWWGINKYHLYYFSRETLEKMFSEVGLKSVRYGSYPRVFSWNYWTKRLQTYPSYVRMAPEFVSRTFGLGDRLLRVTLHDQIGVVAKKTHTLESLAIDEHVEPVVPQKMKVVVVLPASMPRRPSNVRWPISRATSSMKSSWSMTAPRMAPSSSPKNWALPSMLMKRTRATAATRRPATRRRSNTALTSS